MPREPGSILQQEIVCFDHELKFMEEGGWKVDYEQMAFSSKIEGPWRRAVIVSATILLNPSSRSFCCTFDVEWKRRCSKAVRAFLCSLKSQSHGRIPVVDVNSERGFRYWWVTISNEFFEDPSPDELKKQAGNIVRVGSPFAYTSIQVVESLKTRKNSARTGALESAYSAMADFCLEGFGSELKDLQ